MSLALPDLAQRLLGKRAGELDEEETRVLADIAAGQPTSRDAADEADAKSSFGDRLADRVAAVGGSWGFIIGFTVVLFGWMLLNSDVLQRFGRVRVNVSIPTDSERVWRVFESGKGGI